MEIHLPKDVTKVMETFTKAGYQIYVVGGPIRDLLLGKEPKDWDFTTDAKPEQILELFPDGFYNNQFGTVGIPFRSEDGARSTENKADTNPHSLPSILEITTMRKEGEYKDSRHPEQVIWTDKIEEDLARRDFTVNAIALQSGSSRLQSNNTLFFERESAKHSSREAILIDPFNGQQNLQDKIIRAVGDPNKRFQEDALRLMRAIRFASQLNFKIEEKTLQAIQENAHLIQNISWERIRDELLKILATDNAYEGIVLLRETGLLGFILPELERCFGVKQEGPKHDRKYDIGSHSLLSLKNCPSLDPIVRFATLIHDIGKPDTMNVQTDGNVTFYGHDIVGGKIARTVATRLKFSKKTIDKIVKLVRFHMFTLDEHQTDSAIRRFIRNVGLENVDDMMAVRVGDRLGGGTDTAVSWRMKEFRKRIDEVMTKPFSVTDLKINGKDVMEILQIPPSRKVGEVLDTLFKEVQEDSSKNTRDYLLDRLKSFS